ncbi:MAG: hypothetical protein QNJ45_23460 [Ardenticatenaceae bacterium]|nr:hypothetical protein [Ardenticatenaceae bacterium]
MRRHQDHGASHTRYRAAGGMQVFAWVAGDGQDVVLLSQRANPRERSANPTADLAAMLIDLYEDGLPDQIMVEVNPEDNRTEIQQLITAVDDSLGDRVEFVPPGGRAIRPQNPLTEQVSESKRQKRDEEKQPVDKIKERLGTPSKVSPPFLENVTRSEFPIESAAKRQRRVFPGETEEQPDNKEEQRIELPSGPLDRSQGENQARRKILDLDEHVSFLAKWRARKLPDTIPGAEQYNTGLEFVQWRSNPPLLLSDELNRYRQDELQRLDEGGRPIPRYTRSAKHPFWGSRPSLTRLSGLVTKKNYTGKELGSGRAANLGAFPSTFTAKFKDLTTRRKQDQLIREIHPSTSTTGGDLYDRQLQYKTAFLKEIVASLNVDGSFITVGEYNDYPCLMVNTGIEETIQKFGIYGDGEIPTTVMEGFTKFVMSFYSGLVNRLADQADLNTFIAERQSFGYATPSIAETGPSFRISIGLLPPEYVQIHARALQILDQTLRNVFKPENILPRTAEDHLTDYETYHPRNAAANNEGDWRKYAFAPLDKANKSAILNVTRRNETLDFVNVQAFNGIDGASDAVFEQARFAFEDVFQRVLKSSRIEAGRLTSGDDAYKHARYDRSTVVRNTQLEPPDSGLQAQFAEMLTTYRANLSRVSIEITDSNLPVELVEQVNGLNRSFLELIEHLTPDQPELGDLYDILNDYLVIYASLRLLKNQGRISEDDETAVLDDVDLDYGSESEAADSEDKESDRMAIDDDILEPPEKRLKIKKIITHNGMRALLVSVRSAVEALGATSKEKVSIDVKNTYYELEGALKIDKARSKLQFIQDGQSDILARDANAIVLTDQRSDKTVLEELNTTKSAVWVIDTTSSTQSQMREIADAFRKNPAGQLLYLVSSGFKNEQGGADKNSYGTIRVIADQNTTLLDRNLDQDQPDEREREEDSHIIDDVLESIRSTEQPIAEIGHEYRRLLKDLGFVPRDLEILRKPDSREGTDPLSVRGETEQSFGRGGEREDGDREKRGERKTGGDQTQRSGRSRVVEGINLNYLYEDVDMVRLLNHQMQNQPDVTVLPPADNIFGRQLEQRLGEENQQNGGDRTILMPYNIGNYHWVGIGIRIEGDTVRVAYMDPLTAGGTVPQNVIDEIRAIYPNANFYLLPHTMQNDHTSCGPITVQNLADFALGSLPENSSGLDNRQTSELRRGHVQIMNALGDQEFDTRQRENRSTITSNFDYRQYLQQSNEVQFSAKEFSHMLVVADKIQKLEEPLSRPIISAFNEIMFGQHQHADLLDGLRTALFVAAHQDGMSFSQMGTLNDLLVLLTNTSLQTLRDARFTEVGDLLNFREYEALRQIAHFIPVESKDLQLFQSDIDEEIQKQDQLMRQLTQKR